MEEVRTRFTTTRNWDYPEMFDIKGDVLLHAEDEPIVIGHTRGHWIPECFYAMELGDMVEMMDATTQDVYTVAELTREFVEEQDECLPPSFLCIDHVELDAQWRGRDYSFYVMRDWIDSFGAQALVSCMANQAPGVREKLEQHWVRCGFSRSGSLLYVDTSQRLPRGSWLALNNLGPPEEAPTATVESIMSDLTS